MRTLRRTHTGRASRSLALLLAASLATGGGALLLAPAVAAPSTSPTVQMQAKQAQAARVRKSLARARADLAEELAQFFRLGRDLRSTRGDVDKINRRLAQLEARLASLRSKLSAVVAGRYRRGGLDALEVLFGAHTLQGLISGIDFLVFAGEEDSRIIDQVKDARSEARVLRKTLRAREAHISSLRRDTDARRASIESQMARQQAALDALNADIRALVKEQERAAEAAALASGAHVYVATGASWMNASSLVPGATATVEGRPGARFVIPKGQATRYLDSGIGFEWVASTYGNADNAPSPTSAASNRPYNENELTCANKTLPFGTLLAVSRGGKHVIVVVTDRGPYISGRSLDLSTAAARIIGLPGVGTVRVDIVVPAP
jgi:rare lipoprotein A (peptidoglycan hydrolase)